MRASAARPLPRIVVASVLAGIVVFAALSAVILTLPEQPPGTVFAPAGTVIPLEPSAEGYAAAYNFSWGWGGYVTGSWRSTAATTVTVRPRLECFHCPLMGIYVASGTSGRFNFTFGGTGWEYRNMTLAFSSAIPETIRVTRTIELVYPPMTILYPAGTVLTGPDLQARPFDVVSPGAFLVGAWSAVNTTLLAYDGTPQEPASCVGWGTYTAPAANWGSFNTYLMPGPHAVGVALCSTQPWTVTVTTAIGIFYP